MTKKLFNHRVAVLATMHHKEKVIAPILQQNLGINVIVPENFNTDIFGTFSREIKRPDTQIATARLKAKKALAVTGETIAIASEGSFAPHPNFPYIYTNREIIVFLDQELDLEVVGEVFSTETNFNHQVINNLSDVEEFALKVGFPAHGLVLWFEKKDTNEIEIIKGITTEKKLQESVNFALNNSQTGKLHLETDMRALYNPTRMKNIAQATQDLVQKINSQCPKCLTLGFTMTEKIPGLPCEMCSQPTLLSLALVYQCKKCGFRQEKLFPQGKEFADPGLCEYCNP
jgi:predicted Zn-ribbon and HTH transcriptional regulator